MRRHYLFAEDELERSVGEGKRNLLALWHNRRNAMLEGDESCEANVAVAQELTLLWDLAKSLSSCALNKEEYVEFFSRAAKALVLSLSTDAIAIATVQRDWEYDLEGIGSIGDHTKASSSLDLETLSPEQFREAVMQIADIILPVKSTPNVFATFFRELRNAIAYYAVSPSSNEEPEHDTTELIDRLVLRPLCQIPKIASDAFLQKSLPSSDTLRTIHGLQPPNQREMSFKQLLLSYNPCKFSLTRAFPTLKMNARANESAIKAMDVTDTPNPDVVDDIKLAKQLHIDLMGLIGSKAIPVRGKKLYSETAAYWDPEDALTAALTTFPALRIAIVGPPGCGKTRLARVLARRLGLKYLSLDGAIQRAVNRKLRLRRHRLVATSVIEKELDREDSTSVDTSQDCDEKEAENIDVDEELDRVFRHEHFDSLCAGKVVDRGTALGLVRIEATRSLLAGVGVIMDDIYPHELSASYDSEHQVGTDYLIALTALPDELERHLRGCELAPMAGRLYSARELATLKTTRNEELAAKGFADFLLSPKESKVKNEQLKKSESGEVDNDQDIDAISSRQNEQEETGNSSETTGDELLPPPESTCAERNEVELPKEVILPFDSIAQEKLVKGHHEYVIRMQRELLMRQAVDTMTCDLVVAMATQPLCTIRDHCIQAITGTSLGLSRFSYSREVCPVLLPEELGSASRSEKVRWLLYGDWTALLEAEAGVPTTQSFTRYPRRDANRRLLSKWREFCPVTSTSGNALTLGDPAFAACYSGRVYLLASQDARRVFCARPVQFLQRAIPTLSTYRNFWLVTTGAGEVFTLSYLDALETGLHVQAVSPIKLLSTSPSVSMETDLLSGQVVSSVKAATMVAEVVKALHAKPNSAAGWMITDLPLTREVAAVLLEHGCVPDVILLMDREVASAQEEKEETIATVSTLSALRKQHFQAEKADANEIARGIGGKPRVITCPLFCQPGDTLAAIERELNPIAPRLDSIEDGYCPPLVDAYDPTVIFAPPVLEKDEEDLGKQVSTPEEGDATAQDTDTAAAIAARNRALALQGECGRFCPVTWCTRGLLIPGLPSTVCSFRQKFYAFAGESERRAFERNPAVFIPLKPCENVKIAPSVLLLGVRGSGRSRIAAAFAQPHVGQANSGVEYVSVDLAAVAKCAKTTDLLEALKPEKVRLSSEETFAKALHLELQRHQSNTTKAAALLIAGLGPDASRIPTALTLETCFKHGLFPSLVFHLEISEDDAVDTLLSRWESSLPKARRKLALTRKKEADGESKDDDNSSNEDIDEDEVIDLEVAREQESSRLREQFVEDQTLLDEAIAELRARGIKICSPIDATSTPRQIAKCMKSIVDEFVAAYETQFERCEVFDVATGGRMQQLLESGELLIGKHGFACPVTGRTDSLSATSARAVAYRDQLYFPRSLEAHRAFLACPSRYLNQSGLSPRHQPTCSVVGAPISGKTRIAQELAKALELVYVSPQSAIEWVMQCQGSSKLRHHLLKIKEQQKNPLHDPDVTHEAICARLRSSECQARGWVLDGYLLQHHELQRSLVDSNTTTTGSQGIQPDMLFILERSFASVWQDHQAHENRKELEAAFAQWHQFRLRLVDVWTRRFGAFHVRQFDSSSNSFWHTAAQAKTALHEQQQLASRYARAMVSNRAARSIGVVRTREDLLAQQHKIFQTFCPVELRAKRFYNSRPSDRQLCVEFRGFTFWLGNEKNLDEFVKAPEAFVGFLPDQTPLRQGDKRWPTQEEAESEAQSLVAKAPVNASLLSLLTVPDCDFPEMKGYCPVTFASASGANDWTALRLGSVFFRASYCSKVYFFVSEEARRKFCAEPSRYTSQNLPTKLPPQVTLAKSYPGQLEQQLGAALNEVLLALGSERPKFPQISTRASGYIYLALSLKALQRRFPVTVSPDPRSAQVEVELDDEQEQRLERLEKQAKQRASIMRDTFISDCRLGEKLKATSIPAHPSCGSGAKVVRSMRAAHDSVAGNEIASRNSALSISEDVELLYRRFDVIVSGSAGGDTILSVDPQTARMHAKAAFLAYAKAFSSSN